MRGLAKTVAVAVVVAVLLLVCIAAGTLVAMGLFVLLSWIVYSAISYPFTSEEGVSSMPAFLGLLLYALWIIGCFVSMFVGVVGGAAAAIWISVKILPSSR